MKQNHPLRIAACPILCCCRSLSSQLQSKKCKNFISGVLLIFSFSGLAAPAQAQGECGTATYYDTGEVTSSGESFDPGAHTAASSYIPNGTLVVIQNVDNGLEITVEVNDYNPGWGIIDVTPGVMEALDPGGENLSLEVCLYY